MILHYLSIVSQTTHTLHTMLETCPDCNAKLNWNYEPPYQEYPGAKVWGGCYSVECECGWDGYEKGDLDGYHIQENTRGW